MILKYILKNYPVGHKKLSLHRRAVSLIEVLVVVAVLVSISGVFGTKIYLSNRDKAAFERSYKTVSDRISLARQCCVYYGIDVSVIFRKEDGGYVTEVKTTKTLPKKIRYLFSESLPLKGIGEIIFGGPTVGENRGDESGIFFEGTLGSASVREIVLKGKGYEKTIVLF